jgi:hypothetical protein
MIAIRRTTLPFAYWLLLLAIGSYIGWYAWLLNH